MPNPDTPDDRKARVAYLPVSPSRYVRLATAQAATGYTIEAIQTKIKRGVWLEGYEYIRAPDGNVLVDLVGYERWVEGQRRAG